MRIYSYSDDREITLQSSTDTFMLQVQAFVASMEREKARQRTYSAMRRKAEAGHVFHKRGSKVCSNNLEIPMTTIHAKVLELAREALQPDVIDAAVTRALQLQADAAKDREAPGKAAEERLRNLDAEIARLTSAVAQGGDLPSILDALTARQAERERVAATLAVKPVTPVSLATSKKEMRARLEQWREMLQRQLPQARQILKKLLVGPLLFTPEVGTFRTGWKISGQSRLDRLFAGTDFATSVASPTGLDSSGLKSSRQFRAA